MVYTLQKKTVNDQELTKLEVLFKKSPVEPYEPPPDPNTHPDTEVV